MAVKVELDKEELMIIHHALNNFKGEGISLTDKIDETEEKMRWIKEHYNSIIETDEKVRS